jgi:Calcium binding protein from Anabaena CcbP.
VWNDEIHRHYQRLFEAAWTSDMLVLIRWQRRKMAAPLSQLAPVDYDESTEEAIDDWHYWVAQG